MGSKNRHSKEILEVILPYRTSNEQFFVEPFCGGCNVLDKVTGKRIASDVNKYLIAMWKALICGWIPPKEISRGYYNEVRSSYRSCNNKFTDYEKGYIGFNGSYNGRFFDGGYAGVVETKSGLIRNYPEEAWKNVLNQVGNLKDVDFYLSDYSSLVIPDQSIIYCDPPYENTKQYLELNEFDHNKFWDWVREKSRQGHVVFVSEYNAPDDFECVWEKKVNSSLTKDTGAKKATEKLFKYIQNQEATNE